MFHSCPSTCLTLHACLNGFFFFAINLPKWHCASFLLISFGLTLKGRLGYSLRSQLLLEQVTKLVLLICVLVDPIPGRAEGLGLYVLFYYPCTGSSCPVALPVPDGLAAPSGRGMLPAPAASIWHRSVEGRDMDNQPKKMQQFLNF